MENLKINTDFCFSGRNIFMTFGIYWHKLAKTLENEGVSGLIHSILGSRSLKFFKSHKYNSYTLKNKIGFILYENF